MITEIYFVRHAHSEYSLEHEETRELSEQGRKDALTVTKLLVEQGIQAVCSSPYLRAIQTVEGIANVLGVKIDLDERFRERNFAKRNYIVENRFEAMERGFMEPDFAFPGGESNRDVEQRGIMAMNRVLQQYNGKRVAIGIHGGIMTIIMRHYDPRFNADFLRHLPKPDIYKLTFENDKYIDVQKIGTFGFEKENRMSAMSGEW
jgi:2,3-bisphosphoglycerate-dependent phosphoglycerate mutase